ARRRCALEVRLPPHAPHGRGRGRGDGRRRRRRLGRHHGPGAADRARRARAPDAGGQRAARRAPPSPQEATRRRRQAAEPDQGFRGVRHGRPGALSNLLRPMPWTRTEGRHDRPRGDEVHPHAGPDQRRAAEAADRRVLAQLHRRRRRRDARVWRGAGLGRGVAHRELPPGPRAEMTIFWSLVAAAGAVAFLGGARSHDARAVWSIYLVNLVFWSGLAVTGPAIAAMMQLTEARWSPSVRRIALTTAGFLPAAFVLFLVLVAGQTTLYPWVTTPVVAKQAWLNAPFFWLRTIAAAVQDVARIQFSIAIMWMYFFCSQYLVIWYGNVPVETRFFVTRFFTQPWLTLAWLVFVVGWLIPFAYLLKRLTGRPPQRHAP